MNSIISSPLKRGPVGSPTGPLQMRARCTSELPSWRCLETRQSRKNPGYHSGGFWLQARKNLDRCQIRIQTDQGYCISHSKQRANNVTDWCIDAVKEIVADVSRVSPSPFALTTRWLPTHIHRRLDDYLNTIHRRLDDHLHTIHRRLDNYLHTIHRRSPSVDSEDDHRTGSKNASHSHQSSWRLLPPGQSQ